MPEQDIPSLGAMGLGDGDFQIFFRHRRPRLPPNKNKTCLVNYQILRFLTHIRDVDALLVGMDS